MEHAVFWVFFYVPCTVCVGFQFTLLRELNFRCSTTDSAPSFLSFRAPDFVAGLRPWRAAETDRRYRVRASTNLADFTSSTATHKHDWSGGRCWRRVAAERRTTAALTSETLARRRRVCQSWWTTTRGDHPRGISRRITPTDWRLSAGLVAELQKFVQDCHCGSPSVAFQLTLTCPMRSLAKEASMDRSCFETWRPYLWNYIESQMRGKPTKGRRRIQMLHIWQGMKDCCIWESSR